MNSGIHTVIYPVTDVARAKALYQSLLGIEPLRGRASTTSVSGSATRVRLSTPNGLHQVVTTYYQVDDIEGLGGAAP